MSYEISLREIWYKSEKTGGNLSKWEWDVYQNGVQIDTGTVPYGGKEVARREAERAAELDDKRQKAESESYEYNPS